MIRGLDRRPVGLGRLELQEHRRSFESRRRGQPRPQRPISMRLTIVPRLDPSARHHGRGPLPPLGPTHRRRGLSPPRGATHRRPGNQRRPSATSGGSGVHPPDSGTGSAASRLLTRRIRVRRRMSPPWAQQSLPSTPPRTPQAGPSKPRPLAGSPRLGSSAFRTSPRHPRSPPSGWRAPRSGPRAPPSVWRRAQRSDPRALTSLRRPPPGTPRAPTSARRALRDPRVRRGLPGGDPLKPVAGRRLPVARGCAGTSTRRHREHLSGR